MFEIRGGRFGRMPSQLRELLNKFYSLLCAFSSLSHKTSSGDNIRPTTAALSIESHSQLYVKMRIILIKFIWHLRCFYHLAPDLQASSLY